MKKFAKSDIELLKQLCKLTQEDLLQVVGAFLYKHYKNVVVTCDYAYAEGDIPICLVAHIDTVFSGPPKEIYYDKEAGIMWSPQGLGADDRAGVFAIISIIQSGLHPHVIFTTDEEFGGLGAKWLVYDHPQCPFEKCNYLLELDRHGTNDAVFYDCVNDDFIDYIEDNTGYLYTIGLYSDIVELAPKWGMSAVNLSVGYFDEHMEIERLKVPALMRTIEVVKFLLENPTEKFFEWQGYVYASSPLDFKALYDDEEETEEDDDFMSSFLNYSKSIQEKK